MNTKYYKKYIEKVINSNPINIIIQRSEAIDDGFGGNKTKTIFLEPQTVTFYDTKSQREVINDKGIITSYYASNIIKLLATSDTDIKQDDIFEYDGQTFKVILVKTYMDICKQAELEVIK